MKIEIQFNVSLLKSKRDLRFAFDVCELLKEYFPDNSVEKLTDYEYRMIIEVPPKERLWKALLLSFGDKIKIRVVSPDI